MSTIHIALPTHNARPPQRESNEHALGFDLPPNLSAPIAMRAHGDAMFPDVAIDDMTARTLARRLRLPVCLKTLDVPSTYATLSCMRTFRQVISRYQRSFPDGHIVILGCGLTDYAQWIDNGRVLITNADTHDVVELRKRVLPDRNTRHLTCSIDLDAANWWLQIPRQGMPGDIPLCILCHWGRSFIDARQWLSLLRGFVHRVPRGSRLTFDLYCADTDKQRRRLGAMIDPDTAPGHFSPAKAPDRPWIELLKVHDVMRNYPPFTTSIARFIRGFFMRRHYAVYELIVR